MSLHQFKKLVKLHKIVDEDPSNTEKILERDREMDAFISRLTSSKDPLKKLFNIIKDYHYKYWEK